MSKHVFLLKLGGYTTGPKEIIEWLRQKSRPYLFSNSIPPSMIGSALSVNKDKIF